MIDITYFNNLLSDFIFYSQKYIDRYAFLFPLGIIGIWRWSVWTLKEVIGLHYRPKKNLYQASVSIITPVYNEDPKVFTNALESWKANRPTEIIAVIDYTDTRSINIFNKFSKSFPGAVLIVTKKPGKRPALADGIAKAKSDIVALVDSDTIWADNVIKNGLSPFNDDKVAGVGTYQSVLHPKTFAQKIFDVQLDLRYKTEYPFLAAAGDALVCLSGRTAFYRRNIVTPMLPDLVNETFLGKPVISGDDKRLTYLVLAAGWKVAYQSNAHVYTPGMKDLKSYLKQRLRWSRNSLRADLKALSEGWPLKHPALFFFQIDKILQSFVVILSPIYFFVSLYYHLWIPAAIILVWWVLSRTIKMHPHLHRYPRHITLVPGFILFSFFAGLTKIYAMFTLNTQGWITRWDKSRLAKLKIFSSVFAYTGTIGIIVLLTFFVNYYKQHTYLIPQAEHQKLIEAVLPKAVTFPVLGAQTVVDKKLFVTRYVTNGQENVQQIGNKFGINPEQIYFANVYKLPSIDSIPTQGTILSIPGRDMVLANPNKSQVKAFPEPLQVTYEKNENTLIVSGQGTKVTLKDIQEKAGKQYLEEVSPKVWRANATILIYRGVTLNLKSNEVSWLQLESNKDKYVVLRSWDGDIKIDGVKITSWNSQKNTYDMDQSDGRSFIYAKDNSRLDIYNSELAYLGFPTSSELAVSPYGVSWRMSANKLKIALITGEVVNNKFHHNYFGAFTFGATGMLWKGNEFYSNTRYGLDPHDDSNGFLVEENYAHDNGTHGIIFSKRCMYNIIRNNTSINNKLHGIMLHEKSDYNLIENNTITGNTSGVALWRSSHNIVRNNKIENNRHGVRANVSANYNEIHNNYIESSSRYGIYFYDNADYNLIHDNVFEYNNVGVYLRSSFNDIKNNKLTNNQVGVYFLNEASENTLINNQIKQSSTYAIYTKIAADLQNNLGTNVLSKNRKDIVGQKLEDIEEIKTVEEKDDLEEITIQE